MIITQVSAGPFLPRPAATRAARGVQSPTRRCGVDKYEYYRGLPEVGIVPRAPHAGPLLRHVYEQEHGRGGFSGKVAHTYHLYPPTNWLPGETRVLDGFAPAWESPLQPIGGTHLLLSVAPAEPARDLYRGMARIVPKGIAHRFELGTGRHYYWMYESFAGDPEKAESPSTGRFITHSESDYRYPRSLDTRNEAGRFDIVSKVGDVYTRRVHPTHPFDVVGWRGDYLPYRFAVEDVRPLVADRSHVPPSGHTVFTLPGCYLCVFTVRSVEKEGMWLPFFHRNFDYLETLGYHFGDFFSGGGVVGPGMVTLHPVGLPHGPKPRAIEKWLDGKAGAVHNEVAVMADFANPTRVSAFALGLRRADYMDTWSGYTTEPRFTWRADRLDEIRRAAERLTDARDTLTPPEGD